MADPTYEVGIEFQSGSFTLITDDVKHIAINRSLADGIKALRPGGCAIELDNFNGTFSPDNAASSYAALMRPNLQVRVRATHSGSTYNLFRGYVDEWMVNPDINAPRRTTLQCRDALKPVLNRIVSTSLYVDTKVTSIATAVFSAANVASFSVSSMNDQHPFTWFRQRGAVPAINDLLASGNFFARVNGGGRIDFLPRALNAPGTVIASYENFYSFNYGLSDDDLRNDVDVDFVPRAFPTDPATITVLGNPIYIAASGHASFALEYVDSNNEPTPATYLLPPHYGMGAGPSSGTMVSAGSGAAVGKKGALAMRFHVSSRSDTTVVGLAAGTGAGVGSYAVVFLRYGAPNERFGIRLRSAAVATIFECITSGSYLSAGSMHSLAASWDLSTGSHAIVIDGVTQVTSIITAAVNTNIGYARQWELEAGTYEAGKRYLYELVWFDDGNTLALPGQYSAFFGSTHNVRLYQGAASPIGSSPLYWLYNGFAEFGTNLGRASNFTGGASHMPASRAGFMLNTDFLGSGTDITTTCSITATYYGQYAVFSIFNGIGTPAYLQGYAMRGFPASRKSRQTATAMDLAAQGTYGAFEYLHQNPFIGANSYGQIIADQIVARFAAPVPEINWSVRNDFPSLLGLEVGEQAHLVNSLTGIAEDQAIWALSHDIQLGRGLTHTVNVTTRGKVTPDAAQDLAITAGAAETISLEWTAAQGVSYYSVQRSTTQGGPYTEIATTIGTTYTDTGLTHNQTYYYIVVAEGITNSAEDSAMSGNALEFDGTNDYMTRGAGLTGAADGKTLMGSFWLKVPTDSVVVRVIGAFTTVGGSTLRVRTFRAADNSVGVIAQNAAGTIILNAATSANALLASSGWVHVMFSFDLTDTGKRHMYIDDVSDASYSVYTNDTIDFTLADWAIGATAAGTDKAAFDVADLWFAPGQYLDLSSSSNRRKFISATGGRVDLGTNGETPTGTAPLVYMKSLASTGGTNAGSGGNFTITGALTDAAPPP